MKSKKLRYPKIYIKIRKAKDHKTEYQLDMFFKYERKMLMIFLRFFNYAKVKYVRYGKWKCTNPYR